MSLFVIVSEHFYPLNKNSLYFFPTRLQSSQLDKQCTNLIVLVVFDSWSFNQIC